MFNFFYRAKLYVIEINIVRLIINFSFGILANRPNPLKYVCKLVLHETYIQIVRGHLIEAMISYFSCNKIKKDTHVN